MFMDWERHPVSKPMLMMFKGSVHHGADLIMHVFQKTHTTFTSCYLKDIVQTENNFGIKVITGAISNAKT